MIAWLVGWCAIGALLGAAMLEHPDRRRGRSMRPGGWVLGWAIFWPWLLISTAAHALHAWYRGKLN